MHGVHLNAILQAIDITKSYGEAQAVSRLSVDFFAGEVVGLVGPNGSGKSTFAKILSGHLAQDSGTIMFEDRQFPEQKTSKPVGIHFVGQEDELFPELSILENIFAGQYLSIGSGLLGVIDWKKCFTEASETIKQITEAPIDLMRKVSQLSGGQKKAVVLTRVLLRKPKVVIFDETTNSLGLKEQNWLVTFMGKLAEADVAVILISHRADEIQKAAQRVICLDQGTIIRDDKVSNVSFQDLQLLMAGIRK
jgi:ABC-type sugar transport system ATPase subunit